MGKMRRKIPVKRKLEIVSYTKKTSGAAAARKFGVADKCIRVWKKKESKLRKQHDSSARATGGGRRSKLPDFEDKLLEYFREQRTRKLHVTRGRLHKPAMSIFQDKVASGQCQPGDVVASGGWMTNFMRRHRISLRRVTTTCQKTPDQYINKIVDFVLEVGDVVKENGISDANIFACDETAVWLDAVAGTTLADTGTPEVSVRTTGHEKSRVTVMLCARGNGAKCKPFILIQRKRPIPEVLEKFGRCASLQFCGTNGMNQALTKVVLDTIIGRTVFPVERLLVWDKFSCHVSAPTVAHLQSLKIKHVVVPGGCTKFVQAPDGSWNAPFKSKIRMRYDEWMASGKETYTAAGNPRPPPIINIVQWIVEAWEKIPTSVIAKSFKACGITNNPDGTEDDEIVYMKEGRDCAAARALLCTRRVGDSALVTSSDSDSDDTVTEEDEDI